MRESGAATIESSAEAGREWTDHVDEIGRRTLYPRAGSWYLGSNIPGKSFMPHVAGTVEYRRRPEEVVAEGYRGWTVDGWASRLRA